MALDASTISVPSGRGCLARPQPYRSLPARETPFHIPKLLKWQRPVRPRRCSQITKIRPNRRRWRWNLSCLEASQWWAFLLSSAKASRCAWCSSTKREPKA